MDLMSKIEIIDKKVQELSSEADSLNRSAKSDIKNYNDFKRAAVKYKKLVNTYEEYLTIVEHFVPSKTLLLLKANMYHEKYDYNVCYGQYFFLVQDFTKSIPFYEDATNCIKKSTYYITKALEENLTNEERESVEHDYNVWMLDLLLIKFMQLCNESYIDQESGNYASAYDKTKELIDISNQIYTTTVRKERYFTYEDRRKYKAQIEALYANLFTICNMQSTKDFYEKPNDTTFIDIIMYLTKSYEYTEKAIHINNFWSNYKTVRDNIYNSISDLLCLNQKLWLSILKKSNYNSLLVEIMKKIDTKYYKKITNSGGFFSMAFYKNIIKTKGNVIVYNGNNNNATNTQTNMLLSTTDIDELVSFIDYLKNTSSDAFTSEEYIDMINILNSIAFAQTSEQQKASLKRWHVFKNKLGQSALKFLSLSSELVTIGSFLERLLKL